MTTRRFSASLGALAVAFLLLTGCGSAGSGAGPDDRGANETRSITDAEGRTVRVPKDPQRIVVLSEPTLDGALALGMTPIATTNGRGQAGIAGYLLGEASSIRSVGILGEPDVEQVLALDPDLVLVDGTAFQGGAALDRIADATTLVHVSRTGEDWRVAFEQLAEVLGRTGDAQRLLAEYDARVDDVAARLGENARARVSIVRWGGLGLPQTLLQELAASRVLADLGLRRPIQQAKKGPGHSVPVSLEDIVDLDADWMFFGALGSNGGAAADVTGVAASREALAYTSDLPGFDRLAVVRADRVVPIDGSAWTSAGGLLAAHVVVDDVEAALAGASR